MRALVVTGIVLLAACEQPNQGFLPRPSAPVSDWNCQPTIARMVPPQAVMDTMFAGVSPRPTATPSRDAWAATGNWIGNDAMWVSLPVDGVFQRRYAKLWMIPLKGGPVTIKGKQLDGDGSGTFAGTASDGNIGSGVTFSTPGCWELVYSLAGQDLRFTLRVED